MMLMRVVDECLSERESKHFHVIYEAAQQALTDKRVHVSLLRAIRLSFNRVISIVWRKIIEEPLHQLNKLSPTDQTLVFGIRRPTIVNFVLLQQRIGTLAISEPIKRLLIDTLETLFPLVDVMARLEALGRYQIRAFASVRPSNSVSPLLTQIDTLIDDICSEATYDLTKQIDNRLHSELMRFIEANGRGVNTGTWITPQQFQIQRRQVDPTGMEMIVQCTTETNGRYTIRPEAPELTWSKAQQICQTVKQEFKETLISKLTPIIEAKNNTYIAMIVSADASLGGLAAKLKIQFQDHSEFVVQGNVIWMQSKYGRVFLRQHVTFHDVLLVDGTRLGQPSEQRMLKMFVRLAENKAM